MILGKSMPQFPPRGLGTLDGFGIIPAALCLPHFDAIPAIWKPFILALTRRLAEGDIPARRGRGDRP